MTSIRVVTKVASAPFKGRAPWLKSLLSPLVWATILQYYTKNNLLIYVSCRHNNKTTAIPSMGLGLIQLWILLVFMGIMNVAHSYPFPISLFFPTPPRKYISYEALKKDLDLGGRPRQRAHKYRPYTPRLNHWLAYHNK